MKYIAPFYGEFGWEVALWVPHLRYLRKHVDFYSDWTVFCLPGHKGLYTDLNHAVVTEVEPPNITRIDCQNVWISGAAVRGYADEIYRLVRKRVGKANIYSPLDMRPEWDPVPTMKRLLYRNYVPDRAAIKGCVGFHARDCEDKQPERNWDEFKWCDLTAEVRPQWAIWFGAKNAAMNGDGIDYRGQILSNVTQKMAQCEMLVGPSSGPLHLANMCGVPVVWWSSNAKDVPRYGQVWNPFECPNVQASGSWDPSVAEVSDGIARLRELLGDVNRQGLDEVVG